MQTEFHSYVIRMSLLCTRMLSVCHSYVVLPWTQSRVQNVFITINSYDVNCWQKKAAGKRSKKWLTFEEVDCAEEFKIRKMQPVNVIKHDAHLKTK